MSYLEQQYRVDALEKLAHACQKLQDVSSNVGAHESLVKSIKSEVQIIQNAQDREIKIIEKIKEED